MNYNELSQTAHAAAKKNGWYEGEQVSINTKLALIKSEAYEAFEAFRKGKYCTHSDLNTLQEHFSIFYELSETSSKAEVILDFKENIKDTFEDEIADTVIRICDFCGWYGIELGGVKEVKTWAKGAYDLDLVSIDILITKMYNKPNRKSTMAYTFETILGILESIAEVYGFDLEQHINLKLAYNATRGPRHGGKKL